MKNILPTFFIALAAASLLGSGAAVAEAQKKRTPEEVVKLAEPCAACHGAGGAKPIQADYPILAGQNRSYLVASLSQYRAKKRTNAVMGGFAAALKPDVIEDLAEYFSKQPSPLVTKY